MEINKDILGMTLQESEEHLEHHGILGQKWGVRRTPAQLGHKVASGGKKVAKKAGEKIEENRKSNKAKKAAKKADKAAKKKAKRDEEESRRKHDEEVRKSRSFKSPSQLTDAELNARINRLKAEATYQSLLRETGFIDAGKKQVEKSLLNAGGQLLEASAKAAGARIVNKWLADSNNPNPTKFYKADIPKANNNALTNNVANNGNLSKKKVKKLKHSAIDEDYLAHYKYVSKKMVNGKWRYKYANDPKLERSQGKGVTITPMGRSIGRGISNLGKRTLNSIDKSFRKKQALRQLGITNKQYKQILKNRENQKKAERALKTLGINRKDLEALKKKK